jgi:hypothetical protein
MPDIVSEIIRDGGWKSRKLWFSVFAVLILLAGWVLAGHFHSLQALYDTFVGGVVGVSGLYLTGSVATKWVGTKAPQAPAQASEKALGQDEASVTARLPPEEG